MFTHSSLYVYLYCSNYKIAIPSTINPSKRKDGGTQTLEWETSSHLLADRQDIFSTFYVHMFLIRLFEHHLPPSRFAFPFYNMKCNTQYSLVAENVWFNERYTFSVRFQYQWICEGLFWWFTTWKVRVWSYFTGIMNYWNFYHRYGSYQVYVCNYYSVFWIMIHDIIKNWVSTIIFILYSICYVAYY